MNLKKPICLVAAACLLLVVAGAALADSAAPEISTKVDLSYVTKYVWRGNPINRDPAVQPAITFTHPGGLSLNVWGSIDTTNSNGHSGDMTEVDYTLNWAGKWIGKDVNLGAIAYTFPNTAAPTTSEIYGSYCFGGKLAPAVQAFYDIDKAHGIYVQASAGYCCPLGMFKKVPPVSLSGKIGWGNSNHNKFNLAGADTTGFTDALISAAIPFNVSKSVTVTPSISFSTVIDSTIRDSFKTAGLARDNFFGGVDVAFPL